MWQFKFTQPLKITPALSSEAAISAADIELYILHFTHICDMSLINFEELQLFHIFLEMWDFYVPSIVSSDI